MRAEQPSRTALFIAGMVVALARHERYAELLPVDAGARTERLLIEAGVSPWWAATLAEWPAWWRALEAMEPMLMPGMVPHMAVRKRWLDDQVRAAIEEAGMRHIVVLGGGYDTLCLRLADAFPHVRFLEIDHPATQRLKRRAMERLGWDPPNMQLVAANLEHVSLADALRQGGWRAHTPGLFLAEGLLMYLRPQDIATLFAAIREAGGPGTRFAFTYLPAGPDGRPQLGPFTPYTQWSLGWIGEPFRWWIPQEELAERVRQWGHTLCAAPTPDALRAAYFEPLGLHRDLGGAERMAWSVVPEDT